MKFNKIILKNIRSYENAEIEFPNGSLLLSGDIGSGKTTILLAIEYALFGLQPGQKGSALLRNKEDSAEVSLEMEIGGKKIVIERRLKRKSKTINSEYAAIIIDGERVETSITELKTKILELLGYPLEFIKKNNLLYRYTVYTPQEEMKQIILEDAETRLNLLRHIFGIDKYKNIRENSTLVLSYLKEEAKFLQGEIKNLEKNKEKVNSTDALITDIKNKLTLKEAEFAAKTSEKKKLESEAIELELKIKEREDFKRETDKVSFAISTKNDQMFSISKEIDELSKTSISESFDEIRFNMLSDAVNKKNMLIEALNSNLLEQTSQIRALENSHNDMLAQKKRIFGMNICPTCLQDVPEAHKHNIMNKAEQDIVEIKKKLGLLEGKKKELVESIEKEKLDRSLLEAEKIRLQQIKSKQEYAEKSKTRLAELKKQEELFEKDILMLQKHLDSLKQTILEFSRFENLFRVKQEEMKRAVREEKNSEISLAESKKELEMTLKEMQFLKDTISQEELAKKKLSDNLDFSDWLSRHFLNLINYIEKSVMIRLREEFSKLFSRWFNVLVPENSFEVHLDESFTPLVIQNESEMDYAFLSGGERTALALAYRLALNQTINSVLSQIKTRNIIILDEPTDGFSEVQLDRVRDVINELNAEQVIIVSHEQKIEGFVDNVIRLKKQNSSSRIENQKT